MSVIGTVLVVVIALAIIATAWTAYLAQIHLSATNGNHHRDEAEWRERAFAWHLVVISSLSASIGSGVFVYLTRGDTVAWILLACAVSVLVISLGWAHEADMKAGRHIRRR
jgi:hypothetical protein